MEKSINSTDTFLEKAKNQAKIWGRGLWQDKGMTLSLFYLFLPIFLFFFGWLRLPFAVLLFFLFLWLFCRISQNLCVKGRGVNFKTRPEYWITLCVVVFIWVLFSGIGGFSFQNTDFYVRNPIYRDLVNQPWPVFFDFSTQREAVQAVLGSDTVAFVYYFCFWLPPALLSKLFAGKELFANIFLLAWAYLGVMLVLYQIHRYLKRCSWIIPGIFIFFSGFDAVGYRIASGDFELGTHLEWWSTYFQYSSNTTVLYWVFNQAIPVWLIVTLLLNLRGNGSGAGLSALAFGYSPFATFGMIPLAVYSIFREKRDWKKAVTWDNALIPLTMLLVFGSFYLSNPGSLSVNGWIFEYYEVGDLLPAYVLFLVLEIGIYVLILGKCLKKYSYLWVALAELVLIPMYKMTIANDFAMRASMPALLILSICLTRYLLEQRGIWKRWAIGLLLVLAAVTPLSELHRSVSNTVKHQAEPVEWVYSFQDFAMDNENILEICRQQFFAYHPEESFFFHYLGKRK